MPRVILVPLDGSPEAERAVGLAARLARASSATLNLVHVHTPATLDPISIAGMPVIDAELRSLAADHERAYLSRVAADVAGPDLTPVIARIEGPVVPTLIAHARAIHADLIVFTTHGRGGFAQFWLGSVADTLVRRKTPVATFESESFRRIMVLLDGSAHSESVLPHAQDLAAKEGAELILLRVVDTLLAPNAMPYADIYRLDQAAIVKARAAAHEYLDAHAERLRAAGLTVTAQVTQDDEPWRAILAAAEANNVDLIAMATRGQGGLKKIVLGSTADKVLRGCTLPVLLIRPPDLPE
jgi:nucleotide-binding universal stress UspA family protein